MKYKITPDYKLFHELKEMRDRGAGYWDVANNWTIQYFGSEKPFGKPSSNAWGGIDFVQLDEKPDGWKSVGEKWQNFYSPKSSNKAVIENIRLLPHIKKNEVKDLLRYGHYSGFKNGKLLASNFPAINFGDDFILVETSSIATGYIPVLGMTEILESEYNTLLEEVMAMQKQEEATIKAA